MRANKNKFDNYYARWGVHVDSRLTTWVAATHAHNEHHHTPRHTRHRTWLACALRLLAQGPSSPPPPAPPGPRPRGGSASEPIPHFPSRAGRRARKARAIVIVDRPAG